MTTSSPAPLTLQDLPHLLSKHRGLLIKGTLAGLAFFLVASFVIPNKYKSHFNLTIYAKYFQSPLIGDFIPEISESGEMRSQRESLIRQTLTPEFLDSLGEKYGLYFSSNKSTHNVSEIQVLRLRVKSFLVNAGWYHPVDTDAERSAERQELLNRIQIYDLSNNTFNVSFIYTNPEVTYDITKDIYAQVIQYLLDLRLRSLVNVRDAIHNRLEGLEFTMTESPGLKSPSQTNSQSSPIQNELTDVQNQIAVLLTQYTEVHPKILELRDRERMLKNQLQNSQAGGVVQPRLVPVKAAVDGESKRELDSDLMKKLNYLNIAIDSDQQHQADYFATLESPLYPTNSLFPNKGLFAVWGLALGFFGSLFIACLLEYFDRSALHTGVLAKQMGVSLLGELPAFPWQPSDQDPMIKAPPQKTTGRN